MLNICLTFDYELFLGENFYSETEILFQPTEKLLEVLRRQNITSTFFVDVCSVFQYKKFGLVEYCHAFENQLLQMNKYHQDVQLHVHSNWLNSKCEDGKWKISPEGYRIHTFGFDENSRLSAPAIIREGKLYLERILKNQDKNYKCIAYRAGGFCIQPEHELVSSLRNNQILIDSSVAIKMKNSGEHFYDYTDIPNEANWWFSSEDGVKKAIEVPDEQSIFEVPVGSAKNSVLSRLFISKSKRIIPGDRKSGLYIEHKYDIFNEKKTRMIRHVLSSFNKYSVLSLDFMHHELLFKHVTEQYKKYDCKNKDVFLSIILHPKLAADIHIHNMDCFISKLKLHSDQFKFVSMDDIYNKVTAEKTER